MEMKYFSMFSGIGGFELGIQNSNIEMECVGFSEVDKYATSIYLGHFPNHRNFGDATKIKTEDIPDFDFLVGGFPCQAFSIAGRQGGFDDTRGTLFFEIARILKDKRPGYFLLENVRGLLSHNKGQTFQTILGVLSDLGYDVQWALLNSKDYGVPQNRERIFLKGYSRRKCGGKILHLQRNCSKNNERIKQLYNQGYQGGRIYSTEGLSITLNGRGNNGWYTNFMKVDEDKLIPTTREGNCFAVSTKYRGKPLHKKIDNYVLEDCSETGTIKEVHIMEKDYRIRKLTPLECERLQAFPDGYTKYGEDGEEISDTQRYKCLGNAVTTTVITAIVNEMFKNNTGENDEDKELD